MAHDISVIIQTGKGALIDGRPVSPLAALKALAAAPHLTCHTGFLIARLGFAAGVNRSDLRAAQEQKHFDVAELFAFACPAQEAVPTPRGLARVLGLGAPEESEAITSVRDELLRRLSDARYPLLRETAEVATFLARSNWPWAKDVMAALLKANPRLDVGTFATGLNVWDRVAEWEEDGQRPPGKQEEVSAADAATVLRDALGEDSEARPQQRAYAETALHAFAARQSPAFNNILLAEAGTGLGKTLGYLAPSWSWARKNSAPVWLSTYTKNLQRQLDQESMRLLPNPEEREEKIVIRKGRENYLCLLNMQEAFGRLQAGGSKGAVLAALIARWRDTPAMAISLAVISPRGSFRCSRIPTSMARPAIPRRNRLASPTGAANASMSHARITSAASLKKICGPPAKPRWSSPIMRWCCIQRRWIMPLGKRQPMNRKLPPVA